MKILSPINENKDIVNKEYVDGSTKSYEMYFDYGKYTRLCFNYAGIDTLDNMTFTYNNTSYNVKDLLSKLGEATFPLDSNSLVYNLLNTFLQDVILSDDEVSSPDGRIIIEAPGYITAEIWVEHISEEDLNYKITGINFAIYCSGDSEYIYGYAEIDGGELQIYIFNKTENVQNKVTSISSSSTDTEYPSAKLLYDQLATKQASLVSGTNIKTINNQSLLGSGNISISGGGTATDVQINGTSIVNNDVANIITNTAYNSSTNKIATMSDLPSVPVTDVQVNGTTAVSSGTVNLITNTAYNASSNKLATMSDIPSVSDRLKIYPHSGYNVNTCYDAGVYLVAQGSNVPSGSNYGSLLVMPYRQASGNTSPDFGTQIFMPNGDDNTHPNSFYYRTALRDTWNSWQELETTTNKVTSISSSSTDAQYPSAKCVYDIVGDIESLLGGI